MEVMCWLGKTQSWNQVHTNYDRTEKITSNIVTARWFIDSKRMTLQNHFGKTDLEGQALCRLLQPDNVFLMW